MRQPFPTLDEIEAMAEQAYEGLPEAFRALCGDIVIRVADFPADDALDALGLASPYDLLGLFQGIGMAHAGATPWTGQMPNMIWLYRKPILAYWQETGDRLEDIVSHVLIHEIGHHFGLSDEDMERIEAEAGP